MPPESSELEAAVAELDDSYLKVMLTLAVRRASSEEPRRAGFWHALAVTLADEQEVRRSAAVLEPKAEATAIAADESPDLQAVLDELRMEMHAVEAELQEASGHMPRIDPENV